MWASCDEQKYDQAQSQTTSCECNMTEEQLAELTQVLKLAKTTEQKAKELAFFTLKIDRKYEQRLALAIA